MGWKAGERIHRINIKRRRADGVRLLDLLRVPQGRREPDGPPQAVLGTELGRAGMAGMGMVMAEQPAEAI